MRVREHDRPWAHARELAAPVESPVDDHFPAAVGNRERAVSPVQARPRLDLAARPEEAQLHGRS
jgi:hypothetical protein